MQTVLFLFLEDKLKIEKIVYSDVNEISAIMMKRRLEIYMELSLSMQITANELTYLELILSQGYDSDFVEEYDRKIGLDGAYFNY